MADIQNYELDIDLKQNLLITVTCKQLDNLNLAFNIWNDGQVANLSNYACRLKAFKADQVPLVQNINITIKDNVVTIKASNQLTTTSGIVKAELQFVNKTTKEKKTSFNIEIDVTKSTLEVDRSISKATYDLLQELEYNLDKVEDLEFNFNEADKLNKEIKNTTTPNANKINTTLEENTKKATTSNTNLKDSTSNANSTKQAVDSSVILANASKQALDTSKLNADNTKKEVDASVKIAAEKIELIKKIDPENIVQDVKTLKEQVLENTYTKIETDSTLTKLESCKDSFVRNMQIKGKTLQNVIQPVKELTLTKTNIGLFISNFIIKQNVDYSFILNLGNITNATNTMHLRFDYTDGTSEYFIFSSVANDIANKITIKKFKTSKEIRLIKLEINSSNPDNISVNVNSLMCLEGDWTNKEIPSYFEGIKSVGEAEGNRISILTKGKNLWNGLLTKGDLQPQSGVEISNDASIRSDFIVVNANKNYCSSNDSVSRLTNFFEYDINKKLIKSSLAVDKITTSSSTRYLRWTGSTENREHFQIEEGITATDYEKYKEDKTTILLPSAHMGLPDGTNDIINFDKSERVKNVDVVALDTLDKTLWNVTATSVITPNTIEFQHYYPNALAKSTCMSDTFNYYDPDWLWNKDVEGITINQNKNIQLRINKSKLETPDVAGLVKWLELQKPKCYYQLATPVIEKLNVKDELQSFKDGYIQLDNAITPTTQLEYSTNLPSIISRVVENQDKLIDRINRLEDLLITKIATNK